MSPTPRPRIAIVGAGPIGIEAALAALDAGLPFTLYESAAEVAGNLRRWGHVRLFTPWSLSVSPRLRRHLAAVGGAPPEDPLVCPTGDELVAQALAPTAALPAVVPHLRLGTSVVAIARHGLTKEQEIASAARAARPFRLLTVDSAGEERIEQAELVIDASGGLARPNRLGDGGVAAPGERALDERIVRDLPDLERNGARFAGRTTLLVGAGHSAQTVARALAALAERIPSTRLVWAMRGAASFVVHDDDPLPERAALSRRAGELVAGASPAVVVRAGVVVDRLEPVGERIAVELRATAGDEHERVERVVVDEIVAATGSVGDRSLYGELQVHECYATGAPMQLAAALLAAGGAPGDCLAQTSHGIDALRSPEPNFFVLGAKSYGRNSTFLLRVGWQQVDELFAALAGGPS